ncbi:ATP-binding protein [Spongiivirga sp. MCCC 1A20706]|uniref:ATP-binding protein n=1 Tax=Spongiivirga sp. MCCC 1A20706 TaxID=3160963 RepID=UPI003977E17B
MKNRKYDTAYTISKDLIQQLAERKNDSLAFKSALIIFKSQPKLQIKDTTGFYDSIQKYYLASTIWPEQLEVLKSMGDGHYTNQDFNAALPFYIKIDSLSRLKSYIDPTTIGAIIKRSEISRLTFTYESVEEAYSLAKKALSDAKKIDNKEQIHTGYVYLSDLSGMIGKVEECKEYIDKALPYFLKENNITYVSRLYNILYSYYLEKGDFKSADENFQIHLAYLADKNDALLLAKTYYYYGYFKRYRLKKYSEALAELEKSYALYEPLNEKETEIYHRLLRELGFCNLELGNHEKASTFYKAAYELKVDLNKKANRKRSKEVESKYKVLQSEQEIALLSSQNELIKEQKTNQQRLFIAGILLVVIAGIFIFILFRNRQKTTAKLKELDRAKSHFFSNISHELRTPLTLIKGHVQNKLSNETYSESDKGDFEIVLKNTDRLTQLVDQILDISKIESGKMRLTINQANPLKIIKAVAHDFVALAHQRQINFDLAIDNDISNGWIDTDALQKIVTNLISNAIKFTPENGKITLKADIKNNKLHLEIINSGDGLSEEEKVNIFRRFYQSQHSKGGTGIGLALVNELVKLHGGEIHVDSQKNEYTKFELTISLDKANIKYATFKKTQSPLAKSLTVLNDDHLISGEGDSNNDEKPILLIVEDNLDLGNLLNDHFKHLYEVIRAHNGQHGCKIALEKVPDIIISDVMMPVMNGTELTKQLKNDERTSHIPIILLTAKAGDENTLIGLETGADDYITKPFNQKILATKVYNLLSNRKKLRQRYSQEIVLKPKDIAVNAVDELFLNKVQTVLDNHLTESEFKAEAFAETIGMSRMQLHRKLKALTGLSATEFIRSQRLKIATKLLHENQINISQIGYAVGFNDPAYFTKCFKETYGVTPTDFLKKA